VATARTSDIIQSGEGPCCFAVAWPHFSHDAPRLNRCKKTPQVHVGTAQFAPSRGVGWFNLNLAPKVLDAYFERRNICTFGGGRRRCDATPPIVPSGTAGDDDNDNDCGRNED
jgi:hypothetical protein